MKGMALGFKYRNFCITIIHINLRCPNWTVTKIHTLSDFFFLQNTSYNSLINFGGLINLRKFSISFFGEKFN